MSAPSGKTPRQFGPLQIRAMGLLHIAEGLAVLVMGHRAPSLTLRYAFRTARRNSGKKVRG